MSFECSQSAGAIRYAFSAITAKMEAAIESFAYRLICRAKCRVIAAFAALCVAVCVLGIVLSCVAVLEGQRRVPSSALQTTFDSCGEKLFKWFKLFGNHALCTRNPMSRVGKIFVLWTLGNTWRNISVNSE